MLHSLPLSHRAVSSAVVPGPFVLKWCSAKANGVYLRNSDEDLGVF